MVILYTILLFSQQKFELYMINKLKCNLKTASENKFEWSYCYWSYLLAQSVTYHVSHLNSLETVIKCECWHNCQQCNFVMWFVWLDFNLCLMMTHFRQFKSKMNSWSHWISINLMTSHSHQAKARLYEHLLLHGPEVRPLFLLSHQTPRIGNLLIH